MVSKSVMHKTLILISLQRPARSFFSANVFGKTLRFSDLRVGDNILHILVAAASKCEKTKTFISEDLGNRKQQTATINHKLFFGLCLET